MIWRGGSLPRRRHADRLSGFAYVSDFGPKERVTDLRENRARIGRTGEPEQFPRGCAHIPGTAVSSIAKGVSGSDDAEPVTRLTLV
jgi:hypothetical protein